VASKDDLDYKNHRYTKRSFQIRLEQKKNTFLNSTAKPENFQNRIKTSVCLGEVHKLFVSKINNTYK
jgi:hypothetical protein